MGASPSRAVLVTGAEGFIGSGVVRHLVEADEAVHASVYDETMLWRLHDVRSRIVLHRTDITDAKAVRRLVREVRPRRLIHLAAAVDTRRDAALFDRMMAVNVQGTRHLLDALRESGAACAVFAGTTEEYGESPVPFREAQREMPVSPYSWSKVAAAHLVQVYHRLWNVPAVVIRFSVTYGPGQENDLFIPALIRACLTGQALPMTPGEQTREFNYVDDIARGFLAASAVPQAIGRVMNLGSGQEYALRDVARLIVDLTGAAVGPRIGALPYRAAESMRQFCSCEDAERLLGWRPQVELTEGLKRTIAWFQHYLNMGSGTREVEASNLTGD